MHFKLKDIRWDVVGSQISRSQVVIHGNAIKQVSSSKYLGVYMDSDLKWHTQVASVCPGVHQRLFGVTFTVPPLSPCLGMVSPPS